ncbi:hypothetical protein ACFQ3Z_08770 [Streptomyces nogalater]
MESVRNLYNETFTHSYGSVPVDEAQFGYMMKKLKPLLRPGLLQIAELHGEPVAFLLCLPDAHQALHAARGGSPPWACPSG